MNTQTLQWLIEWIRKKPKSHLFPKEKMIHVDIFKEGLIDSFGLLELVSEIENRFQLSLTADNLQDPRFRTLEGISKLIHELKT